MCLDFQIEVFLSLYLDLRKLDFGGVIVGVHENGDDVDHHLSDQYVNDAEGREGQPETVVSHQVFDTLHGVENSLLVYDEAAQKHDASPDEGVLEIVKPVLVETKDEPAEHSEQGIGHHDHAHRLFEGVLQKLHNREHDGLQLGHSQGSVFEQRHSTQQDHSAV